ncbi:hypothetical protein SAMN05519104_4349 [Rhizobiales bacterium GAS188]|nr:hypothetical protein SAMN05519104_4349 [Rhizobiales bacterium GAS188]
MNRASALAVQGSPIWANLAPFDRKLYATIVAMHFAQPPGRQLRATMEQVVRAGALTAHKRSLARSRRRLEALGLIEWPRGRAGVAPPCRLSDGWRKVPESEIAARLEAADKPRARAEIAIEINAHYWRHKPSRRSCQTKTAAPTATARETYGRKVLREHVDKVAAATRQRGPALNKAGFKIGQYSDACGIDEAEAERCLLGAADRNGSVRDDRGPRKSLATIRKALRDGRARPKDPFANSAMGGTTTGQTTAVPLGQYLSCASGGAGSAERSWLPGRSARP